MKKKNLIVLATFLLGLCLISCGRPSSGDGRDEAEPSVVSSHYHDDLYDQRRTEGCWIYAMLACIETEQLRRGDSVTLSRQWLMAKVLREQLAEYRHEGRAVSLRGVGMDVLRLIDKYGLVPYSMEKSRINSSRVLQRKLEHIADNHTLNDKQMLEKADDLLPQFTVARHYGASQSGEGGEESFFYYSVRYTPQQFAESVMHWQPWRFYASDWQQPWHQDYIPDLPDNRYRHPLRNIPQKELLDLVMSSLHQGHPVYWEKSNKPGTGSSDHALAIVGIRRGRDGKPWLLCQNSYGKQWGNGGYCLVSQSYFLRHLCLVGILDPSDL